jgi:8-oxo-dGTP pyrophosphatase MutT (NUDIX family)
VSVAGHVRPGETVLDMLREAEEEIGLDRRARSRRLPRHAALRATLPRRRVDREFQDVYVTLVEGRELTDYALDCAEVTVLYEAPLERLVASTATAARCRWQGWDCQQRRNDDDLIAQARDGTLESLEHVAAWWNDRRETTPR